MQKDLKGTKTNKSLIIICISFLFSPIFSRETFYSQYGQDKYIYEHFFKNKKDPGIFIEIGAYNGITLSNTYFFEKHLGWRGICIEPLPEVFEKLKENRPLSKCFRGCISDKNQWAQLIHVTGPSEMLSGLAKKYDQQHLKRIDYELKELGGKMEIIKVPCCRLPDLLEKFQIFHVDYLSIDVEGGELEILKSIDFNKFEITIISVENNYQDPEFKRFLEQNGYKRIACAVLWRY